MQVFHSEEAFQPIRQRLDNILVPGARLPEIVFQSGWQHYVIFSGDLVQIKNFFPCVTDFLKSRNETSFAVTALEPNAASYLPDYGLFGSLAFECCEDDWERYQSEMWSAPKASNDMLLAVTADVFFVGALDSTDWAIVAEYDGKPGVAAFKNQKAASDFVMAFWGHLWDLDAFVEEASAVYSSHAIRRFLTNYGTDMYPVPTA